MKIYNSPDGHLFVQHGDGSWSFVCFEGSDDTDWIRRTFEPPEPMDELVEWRATAATYPDPTGVPPQGRPSTTALWLLARHPQLAERIGPETAEHLGKWLARLIDQLHSEAS